MPAAKISFEQAVEIILRRFNRETLRDLSREYGVSEGYITHLGNGYGRNGAYPEAARIWRERTGRKPPLPPEFYDRRGNQMFVRDK
jgi:hypothetical protein